jgi:acyl-lipid omega-6 desaturase (Delta-12 desaturase)
MDFERQTLRSLHSRSSLKGMAIFLLDLSVFSGAILVCLTTHALWLQVPCSIVAGIATSWLFVVAHDACHQSLMSQRWLNRLIGTVAFLPCLHPFSFWEFGHNRVHHRFTNRRGKDYVWEPLSHAEFLALSTFQQLKYRFFRTAVGHYWYYLSEIWWKKMFFPKPRDVGRYTRENAVDLLIVSTWLVLWPSAIATATWFLSGKTAGPDQLASSVVLCCVVPFLTFNLLMSSVIYLHHMHPQVGWVAADARVDASRMQMLSSVHVVFPYYTNLVFHRIMEHTAHHMRPGIPMYHLDNGQTVLEETFPEIIVHKWSPLSHLDTLSRCKLFDVERGCWTGYDGVPTAPAIGPLATIGRPTIAPATIAADFDDRPYREAA